MQIICICIAVDIKSLAEKKDVLISVKVLIKDINRFLWILKKTFEFPQVNIYVSDNLKQKFSKFL